MAQALPGGVVHDLPADLRQALLADPANPAARETRDDITPPLPLARNEWICWIQSAKKDATRAKRLAWGIESLRDGQRRPCCWPGCPHR